MKLIVLFLFVFFNLISNFFIPSFCTQQQIMTNCRFEFKKKLTSHRIPLYRDDISHFLYKDEEDRLETTSNREAYT